MNRVLITGASGFIGRHCLPLLLDRDLEIHAVSLRGLEAAAIDLPGVTWHQVDLLESGRATSLLTDVRPRAMLHLAWSYPAGGWRAFRESDRHQWVRASDELFLGFAECGGERVIGAGSCAEYEWNSGICVEHRTPTRPATVYGMAKHALQERLSRCARDRGLSWAWGRAFFVYGPHEPQDRFVASVVQSLLQDRPVDCTHGNHVRDYLHVEDMASAFIALLCSDVQGPVNIASGRPVALRDIAAKIATMIGREDLIRLGTTPAVGDEAASVTADVTRLNHEVGWGEMHDLDSGLQQTIDWWSRELQ